MLAGSHTILSGILNGLSLTLLQVDPLTCVVARDEPKRILLCPTLLEEHLATWDTVLSGGAIASGVLGSAFYAEEQARVSLSTAGIPCIDILVNICATVHLAAQLALIEMAEPKRQRIVSAACPCLARGATIYVRPDLARKRDSLLKVGLLFHPARVIPNFQMQLV